MSFLPNKPLSRLAQIEITISFIIFLVIISLGVFIYQNHTKNNQDKARIQAVNTLSQQLEKYYLKNSRGFYPSLANLQNNQWLKANITDQPSTADFNQKDYSYTSQDASKDCQNPDVVKKPAAGCADFKLSVTLNNGEIYNRLSHNGL